MKKNIPSIYPDLTLQLIYKDGKSKIIYGHELQNTVRQIRFRNQYPIIDYELAYAKLIKYAEKEIPFCSKAAIYFTSFSSRMKQRSGKCLYQWKEENVVFDANPDWNSKKFKTYQSKKSDFIKKVIEESDSIKNYYFFGKVEDFT